MTTRRCIWIFVLLAIVVAVLAFWFMRTGEPRYQGKSLSEWVDEFQQSALKVNGLDFKAKAAISATGDRAIPFLIKELQVTDSKWKANLDEWLYKNFDWHWKFTQSSEHRLLAIYGFWALGKEGEPAISKIASLVTNEDLEVAISAVYALGRIESEKAIPLLASYLTNQNPEIRRTAAYCFDFDGDKARRVVQALINGLGDSDWGIARTCALALRHCDEKDFGRVFPALTNKLNDPEIRVRNIVAQALGSFGTNAIAALPAMQQTYDSLPIPMDRRSRLATALLRVQCEMYQGGIVRGPKNEKKIALVLTGHEFAEGGETILRELSNHNGRASFFLTGTFCDNPAFKDLLQRINREGHYLGPHSDKHLLYCSWEDRNKTLVTRDEFFADLEANGRKVSTFWTNSLHRFFLPAFEYYNREIADWTLASSSRTLINYTPGTRSNADYTGEADKFFVSSQKIFDSIVKHEQEDPDGLNGFILLLHIGVGPNRADKFHNRFGELLDYLAGNGYQFVRVDELLEPKMDTNSVQRPFPNPNPNAPFRRR